MEAGVEIEPSELREKPSGAFPTKFKAKQRAAGATTSVDAQTLQRLMEQQNSLAKFVKEQFEWQKKVNAHVTRGKMVIEEPVLPEWMQEEDEDNVPLSTMNLRAVKKEKVKRARSSATKGKSPAKKKQKKVSSEEEEFKSADLDSISEEEAEKSKKVSMEILSEDEEEETQAEEKGSSSEKTDIEADSPPTQIFKQPPQKQPQTAKPKTPQSKPQDHPISQPSPTQPDPETEPSQHPPITEMPSGDVVTSESTAVGSNPDPQPMSPPKRLRVKSVPKKNPFGRKSRKELAVTSEEARVNEEEEIPAGDGQAKRQKLPIKKKSQAPKGKPATAASAAFVAASGSQDAPAIPAEKESAEDVASAEREAAEKLAELQVIKEREEAMEKATERALEEVTQRLTEHLLKQTQDKVGDVSTDVTTSKEPEVVKAQVDPQEPTLVDPAALAIKAWEEAKKRIAETSAKKSQEAEASVATGATSGMVGSDETTTTTTTTEAGGEKKKEKKKKADKPGVPTRQSRRLRSDALNK